MNEDVIYRGRIVDLVKLGGRWEVVRHVPAVVILVEGEGEVLGVRQHRPAIGRETWELPAGLVDRGEDPEAAAHRELAEEVGLAAELELISQAYSSPGFSDELIYLYRARNWQTASGPDARQEELTLEWRDPKVALDDLRSGKLASSMPTALGLAFALNGRLQQA